MQITQYYPVIQTDDVAGTADFNRRHFGFRALFDSNWYVHLQNERDEAVNLAILDCDHETIPQAGRGRVTAGLILNFEVEDVDGEDTRLRQAGVTVAKSLRDEDFAAGYAAEALPG